MKPRVLPAPDPYACCPLEGRILEFYRGTFDSAYICLSPFIEAVSMSPDLFCPATYPDNGTIARACRPVPWSEVVQRCGLPDLAALDIGLRTAIGGLREDLASSEYEQGLTRFLDSTNIVPPAEGEHSPLLHAAVLDLFQELGHEWVWIGDEFCTERKLYWIDDLKGKDQDAIRGRCNVFAPNHSLLWTVHWDSHFSLLCASSENLRKAPALGRIEGFFCSEATEVYWSIHNR